MPSIQIIHKDITVTGQVQGVGFRFSCRNMANSLGIKGFVKNLLNGDVYIEAEGTEVQLKHLIDWCSSGPGYASITEILVTSGSLRDYSCFEIRH